jgi:hypothetical protein
MGGPANQQLSSLSTPAIDPVLLTLSPRPPDHGTGSMLHGEDLTQLARHLILQKSLSKNNADELVSFAKVFASVGSPVVSLPHNAHSGL